VEGVAADPRYVDISIPPGKTKRIKVETTRNAFAYVFAGAGSFRDASAPQAVLTESAVDPNAAPVYDARNHSLVLFDRGDEIVVQAGPRASASCWFRASRWRSRWPGTADCDEYTGRVAASRERVAEWKVYQAQVRRGATGLSSPAGRHSPVRCCGGCRMRGYCVYGETAHRERVISVEEYLLPAMNPTANTTKA